MVTFEKKYGSGNDFDLEISCLFSSLAMSETEITICIMNHAAY